MKRCQYDTKSVNERQAFAASCRKAESIWRPRYCGESRNPVISGVTHQSGFPSTSSDVGFGAAQQNALSL